MIEGLTLGSGISTGAAAALMLGAVSVVLMEYWRLRRGLKFRLALTLLRSLSLILILGALLQPLRLHSVPDDRESSLLVLVDASRSMGLPVHPGGESRLEWALASLYSEGGVLDQLADDFRPRVYGFDAGAHRVWDREALHAEGMATDLSTALEESAADLADTPLAGVLLVSDGAHNGEDNPLRIVSSLRDDGISVHALAVGAQGNLRDLRIAQVSAPEQVVSGAPITVWVDVTNHGETPVEAPVEVVSADWAVATETVRLHGEGSERIRMTFAAGAPGVQHYAVEIPPQEGEIVTTNNRRIFMVDVIPREELLVLFLEGRPRAEFAYLKRALEKDDDLVVEADIALNAKSDYRIRLPGSVASAEIMQYDAIILGDVRPERLLSTGAEALERFVGDRGGGLLVLGSESLRSPAPSLADLLPVTAPEAQLSSTKLRLMPSRQGQFHPIVAGAGPQTWARVPELSGYLPVSRVKPGASVLLEAQDAGHILMATHRFGAGKVAFFSPTSSWRWRSLTAASEDDYERFWIRTIRWLVTRTRPVTLEMDRFSYELGTPARLAARVVDESHQPRHGARVSAAIRSLDGSGAAHNVNLSPALGMPGLYEAEWEAATEGEFQIDVWAMVGGSRLGEARGFLEVRRTDVELEGRTSNVPLLKRLTRAGDGLLFRPDEVGDIADRLPLATSAVTREIRDDLWDTPLVFVGIMVLLCTEWLLRRRRGLVLVAGLVPGMLLGTRAEAADPADGDLLRVAYVEHQTRGGWGRDWQYYGGRNMASFLRRLGQQTSTKVHTGPESVSFRDEDRDRLFEYPILFMTSNNPTILSDEEVANMREYLLRGGFLIADDCVREGSYSRTQPPAFTRAFIKVMERVFPEHSFTVIPHDHPIYHCVHDFPDGLPQMHPSGRWDGLGLYDGDRLMVLLSPNDFCCGWQLSGGQWTRDAFRMGINAFVYALTH